jgi:hypothetical protein
MTRKDYELIAKVLKDFTGDSGDVIDRDKIALSLALALELDNPRFNRERFLVASGYITEHTSEHLRTYALERAN